jgi:zinc transport system permease protein
LAFGLLAASTVPGARLDLSSYLFGDILAVTRGDLALIWGGALLVVSLMAWRWQRILTATLSPDLAIAAGISPRLERYVLMLALAVVVAVAIKVVGALLIGAMLIIPPAVARGFARTPETMVLWTAAVGFFAAVGGLAAAWELDTPAGPSIVCAAALMFMASLVFRGAVSQG